MDATDLGRIRPFVASLLGEHDDHERRQIEQQDQPRIAQAIGKPYPAHQVTDGGAQRHRQGKSESNARQCHAEIKG